MDAGLKTYVSSLNEFAQKKGWSVRYDLVNTNGQEHMKTFTMMAVINGKNYPVGFGPNKKEAKQNAAKNALSALENDESINTETNLNTSFSLLSLTQPNFTCWLNEYSHKTRLQFNPVENNRMGTGSSIQMCYTCKYICGDKEFPEATGRNKKEAKEAAAELVYNIINEQEKEQDLDDNASGEESLNKSLPNSRPSTPGNTESTRSSENFIGLLNHYCQKCKLVYDFKSVAQKGPAHDPEFAFKVVINNSEFPEGRGKTAKEAKQKAAQLAWSELPDSGLSSQILSPSSMSKSEVFPNSSPVAEPQPLHIKPKIQIAAKFQNSPVSNKKEQSNINGQPKTDTVSDQPTSRFLEEFDIKSISRIGSGGFGRVFKARRKLENTTFAVKIVRFTKKARREVEALSKLFHPNIVRYHTSWTEKTEYRDDISDSFSASSSESGSEFLYIQMEFCEGETLEKWIKERDNHPEKYPDRRQKATEIIKQVLKAVAYVHLKNLFHRDLKPANIMFGLDGGVKVVDFGLVTNEERDGDGILLERTMGAGTRSYMSPEQIQEQDYNKKVDIYAVGLIYFELLWRFGTQNEKSKRWDDIRSKTFPEEFFKSFDFEHKLIERMLCEKPEERSEASNLLTELEQHSTTNPSSEHKVSDENTSREDNLNQSSSNTRFAYKVVNDIIEFPEGRETIAKEAKQKAAHLAWSECTDSGLISQEQSNNNTVSHQPPTSRFLEEFDIKSITRTGRGGFGRVFKARRRLKDTTFAVKIVKFNDKARREVEALSSLNHPNIVHYDVASWTENTAYRHETSGSSSASFSESESEFLYIQMEFCEGETLKKWIKERDNHPEKYPERRQKATEIIKQVLKAVKYIHLKNLFHRDLKPANIMFGPDGGVKVVDFGLVTNEERDGDEKLLKRTKGAGTRSYMSPEQIQGRGYDRKVDIFAVGLIYFVLLWRFGTQENKSEKIKLWHDIRSKKFPEEFSKSFDFEHKLIDRMLCKKPEERSEASDLLTELEQQLDRRSLF
ncbi:LOW QUALITY PROTEIN: protein kinase 3-like [Clarias gariepinus]|uniref:LOW QUALITY PROTEIN: protein kinase 3-like n=1 Tax=Clarias gariepinus TaxID=13013 RepID=UPI00234E08AD|nr:LOW QUALITY PROTEIN: protein kinase 3-like [Clarias gariepinus]